MKGMKAFVLLSSRIDKQHREYPGNLLGMAKSIGLEVIFGDAVPAAPYEEWVAEHISEADFSFFDVTDNEPDCLIALGIALEQDVEAFALHDVDASPFTSRLLSVKREYLGPGDFARKVQAIILKRKGVETIQNHALIERIKNHVRQLGPLPSREIAKRVGQHPADVRPVVKSMVDAHILMKLGDRRWMRYGLPSSLIRTNIMPARLPQRWSRRCDLRFRRNA